MSLRISKICLIVYGVLLVLSPFLLSTPGDYWPWYAVMAPFAVLPLCLGPRWCRVAGGIALLLCGILIVSDVEQGKRFNQQLDLLRQNANAMNSEQSGQTNGNQSFRSRTNTIPSSAGSRR
jgi:hypothetical protein